MNKKDITIITLWNDEKIEVDMEIENFIQMQNEDLQNGIKEFYISKLKRSITYADIKGKQGKTNYISLPEPKEEALYLMGSNEKKKLLENNPEKYYQLEKKDKERRKKINEIIKNKINLVDIKKKKFLEKRTEILKRLAFEEKELGLETTLSKLEELEKFKKQEFKNLI